MSTLSFMVKFWVFSMSMSFMYSSPGAVDHDAQHFNCLWVHWYDLEVRKSCNGIQKNAKLHSKTAEKPSRRLDGLSFLPWDAEDAVGFIDPANVLHGCHIIPAFLTMKSFPNGGGSLSCARDSEDWNTYYISQ